VQPFLGKKKAAHNEKLIRTLQTTLLSSLIAVCHFWDALALLQVALLAQLILNSQKLTAVLST
jgi:hypothetical protein